MKRIIPLVLLSLPLQAGMFKEPTTTMPEFRLQLQLETHLTNLQGVLSPTQLASVKVGDYVVIYRPDGFCYKAQITDVEEGSEFLKVWGKANNSEETTFGFVMRTGGILAGAILERKTDTTYVLELDLEHKGYVFKFTNLYKKPSA